MLEKFNSVTMVYMLKYAKTEFKKKKQQKPQKQPFPFLLKGMSQGNEKLLIEFWNTAFDSFNAVANRSLSD